MSDIDMAAKYFIMYADKALSYAIDDAKGKYTTDDFIFADLQNENPYEDAFTDNEEGEWIEYDDINTGQHIKEFVPYGR